MTTLSNLFTPADPFSWVTQRPFFQAGLQGYSDASMRIIARRLGAPFCVTEALADHVLTAGGKGLEAAKLDPEDHPIAGQIIGAEPETMAAAANLLVELGYDVVDVNLACPVRKVRGSYRGGHLMLAPDVANAILAAVSDTVAGRVPVTVKLRRGTDDSDDARRRFHSVFDKVVECGYHSATVHGRTVEQKYKGPSRWSFLKQLVSDYSGFSIFGSGDIFAAEDIYRMRDETGVRAVSVARGGIGNPWIFREALALSAGERCPPPALAEQRQVLTDHCALARRLLGDKLGARRMHKLGIKFSRHHPDPEVTRAFWGSKNLQEWYAIVEKYYPASVVATDPASGGTASG